MQGSQIQLQDHAEWTTGKGKWVRLTATFQGCMLIVAFGRGSRLIAVGIQWGGISSGRWLWVISAVLSLVSIG